MGVFSETDRNGDRSVADTNTEAMRGTKPIKECPFLGEEAWKGNGINFYSVQLKT